MGNIGSNELAAPPLGVPVLDEKMIALLRKDLIAADWTVDRTKEMLGPIAWSAQFRDQRVPGVLALANSPKPAAILTRLFVLGDQVTTQEVQRALPRTTASGAAELGLLRADGDTVTARLDLRPHAAELAGREYRWWVASDLSETQTGRPLHPEHVLGIGSASLSLLRMTVRDPVERALDLGSGCGIQALYLAAHAQCVVATDLSVRACAFTRFNAALNEANIDVRHGSLFEPVEGEQFDLITSNPPFVITPDRVRAKGVMEYRDGGMPRDNLIAEVITTGPEFLRTGGLLQMLANWEIRDPEAPWQERVETWLTDAVRSATPDGLRAWVVAREMIDYARYAELWMRDSGGGLMSRTVWESNYREWVRGFTEAGVDHIAMGFLAVQRSSDIVGLQCEAQFVSDGVFPDGPAVISTLQNISLPAHWQEMVLTRTPDVREQRYYVPGSSDPELIFLSQGAGMERKISVSTTLAALVGASDGELNVKQIVGALSVLTDVEETLIWAEIERDLPQLLQSNMVEFVAAL